MRIGQWTIGRENLCWQKVANRTSWAERFSRRRLDILLPFTTSGGALWETTLYQVVQEQLESFLAQVEARTGSGLPEFVKDEFEAFLDKLIAPLMRMLTGLGYLVEEQGVSYLADIDAHNPLRSLQGASCTYRIALGPRAGQKVLSLRTLLIHLPARAGSTTLPSPPGRRVGDEGRDATAHAHWRLSGRDEKTAPALCAQAHGFSLHAGVRAAIVPGLAQPYKRARGRTRATSAPARMGWARLLKRVFDIDVEHCAHCGGDLKIIAAIESPP